MIARIWKGAVRRSDSDAYSRYMTETGVAGYAATDGNAGVWMLRRDVGDNTEFLMFTLWDSLDAVRNFAGEGYEAAVFYPRTTASWSIATCAPATGSWTPRCGREIMRLRREQLLQAPDRLGCPHDDQHVSGLDDCIG
jgi:heme-degrading monooxygenase HmoA